MTILRDDSFQFGVKFQLNNDSYPFLEIIHMIHVFLYTVICIRGHVHLIKVCADPNMIYDPSICLQGKGVY